MFSGHAIEVFSRIRRDMWNQLIDPLKWPLNIVAPLSAF